MTALIGPLEPSQGHANNRRHGKRQHDAHESKDLTCGEQCKNNNHWVQTDSFTDQFRSQKEPLQDLSNAKNKRHNAQGMAGLELQQRRHQSQQQAKTDSNVGDENGQTGKNTNRQGQTQAGNL